MVKLGFKSPYFDGEKPCLRLFFVYSEANSLRQNLRLTAWETFGRLYKFTPVVWIAFPFRGYGYVPLRNGGNVVRRMGTQQWIAFFVLTFSDIKLGQLTAPLSVHIFLQKQKKNNSLDKKQLYYAKSCIILEMFAF